jgi:hypothetical protein
MQEFIRTGIRSTDDGAFDRSRWAPDRQHLTRILQRFQSDGELLIATLADVRIVTVRSQTLQKRVMRSEISR